MQRRWLWIAMASAGLLSACGGGGGGGGSTAETGGPGPLPVVNMSMSGTAAKGLMANADVTAHAINADGTVATEALARTTTDAQGHYALSFKAAQVQPYVIKVTANDKTTHLDEVTGVAQPLPAGFVLRSLVVPSGTGDFTASVSVTPFSEMAVAAAAKASGGLSSANVAQARANVAQLLGFDPATVEPKSLKDADTPDQKRLAVMLSAVSQLAHDGALGCDSGAAAAKTQCVVDKLNQAVSTSTLELKVGSVNVSGALAAAATTVLANPQINVAKVSDVVVANVISKLACTGSSCTPAAANTPLPSDTTGPAIAAAKGLFTNIRSDWRELFASGSPTDPSAFEAQASKFEQSMRSVQAPVEMVGKDLGVLLMGVDLYNDFKAGRSAAPVRARAAGAFVVNSYVSSDYNAVSCQLTQDRSGSLVATAPVNANFISCRASYYVAPVPGSTVPTDWAHGFTLEPSAMEAGKFAYTTRARYRAFNVPSSTTMPGTSIYSGSLSTSADSQGHVTAFSVAGDLPGAFAMGGNTLVSTFNTWSLSGSRAISGANASTSTLSGQVVAKGEGGSVLGTLAINSASLTEVPVSRDASGNIVAPGSTTAVATAGGEISGGAFDVLWTTPSAEFQGKLALTDAGWDKSQTLLAPTKLEISGALRTMDGSTKTEFFAGKLTLSASGLAQYDDRLPSSSSNYVSIDATLQGAVTAPNRPQLELTVGTSMKTFEKKPALVTVAYRSLVNGTPKTAVNLSASRNAAGAVVLSLNEAASNLSMTVTEGAATADLLVGGSTVVGRLTTKDYLLTFVDGSFVSLDLGL